MLHGECCSTVAVVGAAVARRCRSHVVRRVLLHCGRRLCRFRQSMQESCCPAMVAPPSLGDAGVMSSGDYCSAVAVGAAAVARRCRSMLAGDGCFTVAVGDAAVARRCRSHVALRVLLHCGRRWCRFRQSMQESCCPVMVAPPSPADAGVGSSGDYCSAVAVGVAAVACPRRSHVGRRWLLHRARR
jgi:hypothetical protein